MSDTQVTLLWIYGAIIAVWPVRLIVLMVIIRRMEILTPRSPQYAGLAPPLVSAILPAKDEESHLAGCLSSVCRQSYPNLEILVVNDRSTDRTEAIAREFASQDKRIRVLKIDLLPAGWTGKTHALHFAAEKAGGRWLWFLDADTLHAPESLAIMMEFARAHQASLVSLLPELRCETFWERVVQPLAGITLMQSFPLHKIHDIRSPLAFANGQYILIESSAYQAAGGHAAVCDRFVEDIALATRVKALGLSLRIALIQEIVSCRMYSTLSQLVRGWSRIFYAALDRRPGRLLLKLLDPLIFCQTGHLALAAGVLLLAFGGHRTFALWLLGLSVIHHAWMYDVFRRVYALSVRNSSAVGWFPLGNLLIDLIMIRAIHMCLTGRVNWRGTDYVSAADSVWKRTDSRVQNK
jgi:glycosyltransferase involved in cell wall biosynthesis